MSCWNSIWIIKHVFSQCQYAKCLNFNQKYLHHWGQDHVYIGILFFFLFFFFFGFFGWGVVSIHFLVDYLWFSVNLNHKVTLFFFYPFLFNMWFEKTHKLCTKKKCWPFSSGTREKWKRLEEVAGGIYFKAMI